jgi:hypothetical protein
MTDTMPGGTPDRTSKLRSNVRQALDAAWVDVGYAAPNADVYPWLWLWDSCFHSLIWLRLGEEERAVQEVTVALSTIDDAGFVAHMGYQLDPQRAVELWGRAGASSITQPPMFGHTLAELHRAGVELSASLLADATRAFCYLLHGRRRVDGLVSVVHPWETGCDDSPRWDDYCPGDGFDLTVWRAHKVALIDSVERGPHGEPLHNPAFPVASAGFNALLAWNATELASITGDEKLAADAAALAEALDEQFDDQLGTWVDAGPGQSGGARTADGLLGLLTTLDADIRRRATAELVDPNAHASRFGPRGVHAGEDTYDPSIYWRGPVWPQLAYLLWVALDRSGDVDVAADIRARTIDGAIASGLAEYWNGDTGQGLGAIPQSWTGLAVVLDDGSSA